ncbi:MAG: tRNA-(ms[2]io[6]A)-hydroxylase [Marivirga sp.]|jgi:tRNA-(ms[2]io[6]A)-hydroxylase
MRHMDKFTLGLNLPTDPRWANIAEENIEEILIDHAYCEQKAASSCISMIVNFPEFTDMVETLAPVVAEEWSHFERVLEQLKKRGFKLSKPRKDEYVSALMKVEVKGGDRKHQVVEKLLINALIEARSCERFKQLHLAFSDQELKNFYYELMISEAGHYRNFIDLAENYMPKEAVQARWQELLVQEAEIIMNQLQPRPDRMH